MEQLIEEVNDAGHGKSDLERLALAVTNSGQLAAQADDLVGHFVEAARRAGASWAEIGRELGVSKQAAHQRFVPSAAGPVVPPGLGRGKGKVLGRFTDRARKVLIQAQEEAWGFNHNYVGTEHLLLALMRDPASLGAKVLAALGLTAEPVRAAILELIGTGDSPAEGPAPFTPRAKKVLELSLKEALQLGHNYVGTEHLTLALVVEGEGVAAQVLMSQGVDYHRLRKKVWQLLARGA